LIRVGWLSGLFLRDLEISLRTGRSLVCLNEIKTRLRVAPLTERQGHEQDYQHDRYGDHDYDFACPYSQRHGHDRNDTGPPPPTLSRIASGRRDDEGMSHDASQYPNPGLSVPGD
jgi:hypothetical protein